MKNSDDCLLTIVVFTYNLKKYVPQSLESILSQKVNFKYQIIIADDCSTDGTIDVIKDYQQRYPDLITLMLSDKNQKLTRNSIRVYEVLKTEYFTILDGDDYWTDCNKLQEQIDFLQNHPNFTICGHNTKLLYESDPKKEVFVYNGDGTKDEFDFSDILNNVPCYMHTSSTMFRNVIFKHGVPKDFYDSLDTIYERAFEGDSIRNYIHLEKGKMKYIDKTMSVYQIILPPDINFKIIKNVV
jgi:glycosyltransferase involved in cell wall biosynthesis